MSQLMYSPFSALNELHRELNSMFDERYRADLEPETGNWVPQVDIRENDERFLVIADLPGVDPKDVEVTLDRNVLTIKGERDTVREREKGAFTRKERISGNFVRQFMLPETADGEGIKAKAADGVLEISIPKTERNKQLSIKVES